MDAPNRQMTDTLPSLAKLKPNPHWARLPLFNRKSWSRVRFGDVVKQLKKQVDPAADDVERYVAGEHMETENVHIHQWGNVGDGYLGPAFIRGFRKGQVLYGSRRTYLKKVAVAEWDGVTANTTYVLVADETKLLQRLLPWLMLSEKFTRHSVQESKGSTNPYINFPDIAKFEFDLPPLDQQRRIAEILWAVDDALQANENVVQAIKKTRSTTIETFINGDLPAKNQDERRRPKKWETRTIGQLCDIKSGKVNSRVANENGKYPFFTCAPEVSRCDTYSFDCEALLLAGNNAQGIYTVKHFKGKFQVRQRVYVITIRDLETNPYDYLHLAFQRSLRRMQNLSVGSTSKHITLGDLQSVVIPIPPLKAQAQFVSEIQTLDAAASASSTNFSNLKELQRQLVDAVFANRP